MSRDSRLSGVLHVLLHMAESEGPVTSEDLARAMGTNPAVVRRTLAGLRERGLVRAGKGRGGGWRLGRDLADITLADVFEALGGPSLFAIGHRDADPACLVEQAVNAALDGVLQEAEALLLARFSQVSLQALSADFHARLSGRFHAFDPETAHVR
jgi:Rrf2 family protein